jgi:hypothetical protein
MAWSGHPAIVEELLVDQPGPDEHRPFDPRVEPAAGDGGPARPAMS